MNYYLYQALNLMPQAIVIQIVALMYSAETALIFTKTFAFVNILSVLVDWGASSIGAKYLNNNKKNYNLMNLYSSSYEFVRIIIFFAVILLYYEVTHAGVFEGGVEINIGIMVGLFGGFLFPHWINLANEVDKKFILGFFIYRSIGIGFLIGFSFFSNNSSMLAVYYYAIIVTGAIFYRLRLTPFSMDYLSISTTSMNDIFQKGLIFTIGSFSSYLITGAGAIFILKYFESSNFVNFMLAERFLASGRVMLGLVFQKNFIKSSCHKEFVFKSRLTFNYVAFLIFFCAIINVIGYLFYNASFNIYFSILFVGFSLSGYSHIWVTQKLLGNEKYAEWMFVLAASLLIYLTMVFTLSKLNLRDGSLVASVSTLCAEITIFSIGFLLRKK